MLKGSDVVIDVLKTENVSYVFGNPGTTELALVDALVEHQDIKYVLGLQEAAVVGMADGYARATNRPAFVNLHAAGGLGNGLGALTNAAYTNVPMVVTAGQQHYGHIVDDPWLTGDLVSMARPLTKSSHEVRTVDELGTVLRRAFKDANTYPKGPVFVSLPFNFMDEETSIPAPPKSTINMASTAGGLEELVESLLSVDSKDIAIIACDEIANSDAFDEIVNLVDALGADVYGSPVHASTVFPTSHPLWKGALLPVTAEMNKTLSAYKKVFIVGERGFMAYVYTPVSPVPEGVDLLHLSADPTVPAMTFDVELGVIGDVKTSLAAILSLINVERRAQAADIIVKQRKEKEASWAIREAELKDNLSQKPIMPETAAYAFIQAIPDDAVIVDEAPATLAAIREFFQTKTPLQYNFSKGGGLGWAMPAAIGISLGNQRSRTFCLIGDGAAMYSPQAFWSAVNQNLPITYIVFNNTEYGVLKNYLRKTYPTDGDGNRDDFIGMDVNDPKIDYLALGQSMGVPGERIEDANQIAGAVQRAMQSDKPSLIEIMIAPSGAVKM